MKNTTFGGGMNGDGVSKSQKIFIFVD